MKLLFITSSRVGDAVLSTGLLNHFVEKYPGITITVAASPLTIPLFEGVPCLERLISLEKKSDSRHWFDLWKQCSHNHWDIIVDIRGSIVSYFLKSKNRYIWKSTKSAEHRVIQLGALAGVMPPPSPHLWLKPKHIAQAQRLFPKDQPVLALAPAAHWVGKQWPASSFSAFIRQFLVQYQAKVAIFAAPHERATIQPVLEAIPEKQKLDLIGSLSFLEIAACLKQCRAFLGNDSGLMHMAAAAGIPTLGLFGPSDDRLYAPWGSQNQVIRTPESLEDFTKLPYFSFSAPMSFMENLKPETVLLHFKNIWER